MSNLNFLSINKMSRLINPNTDRTINLFRKTHRRLAKTNKDFRFREGWSKFWNSQTQRFNSLIGNRKKFIREISQGNINIPEGLILNPNTNRIIQDTARNRRKIKDRFQRDFDINIENNNFQIILDTIVNNNINLTMRQASILWRKIQNTGRFTIDVFTDDGNVKTLFVNNRSKDWFINVLTQGVETEFKEQFGSDVSDSIKVTDITSIIISKTNPSREMENKDGGYFSFINNTNLDLSRYQIYNQRQAYFIKSSEHCLIRTLILSGVSEDRTNAVKLAFVKGANIRKKELQKIVDIIGQKMILYQYYNENDTKLRKTTYEPESLFSNEVIHMAIYKNHYFIFEKTKYSKFCINNYEEVKDEEDFENILRKHTDGVRWKRGEGAKITSLLLMRKLFEGGYFCSGDLINFQESTRETKENIYLENIENEQGKPINYDTTKETKVSYEIPPNVYFADCESFVNEDKHKLYLLGVADSRSDVVDIFNVCDEFRGYSRNKESSVVNDFLKTVTKSGTENAIVYFHNLKYDYHLLERHLNMMAKIQKDGQLYRVQLLYKGKKVELRDSYKLAGFALSKFQKNFNLPEEFGKKEAICYNYYTKENNNKLIETKEYRELLPVRMREIFDEQVKQYTRKVGDLDLFNPTDYYIDYLVVDCLCLKKGY